MIIGLVGQRGSGKSTAKEAITERYGYEDRKFAGPLKEMLRVGFGLGDEELEGSEKELPSDKLCGATPRWAMQSLGAEWARDLIHPDIWTRGFETACDKDPFVYPNLSNVVVDDVRFENEVDLINSYDGFIIRIFRGDVEPTHESEDVAHLECHVEIENSGTKDELKKLVLDVVDDEFNGRAEL